MNFSVTAAVASDDRRVVLGHRRLAIETGRLGDQPTTDPNGRSTVTINGEIYNHQELHA
jgi:asparagine synthetase B (glutamine-hydrolysing)